MLDAAEVAGRPQAPRARDQLPTTAAMDGAPGPAPGRPRSEQMRSFLRDSESDGSSDEQDRVWRQRQLQQRQQQQRQQRQRQLERSSSAGRQRQTDRSSSAGKQRQAVNDSQRTTTRRPSLPVGGESQTPKPRSRRASQRSSYYGPPDDLQNLDDATVPSLPRVGVSTSTNPDTRLAHLEDTRAVGPPPPRSSSKPGPNRASAQSSKRNSRHGELPRDALLSESAAPAPIPPSAHSSRTVVGRQRSQALRDEESGYTLDDDDSDEAVPPPFSAKHPHDFLNGDRAAAVDRRPKWLIELYIVSYLILFAILGTLARLGMQWITFYPGAPIVTPVIWANVAGSLFMGFLSEDQRLFRANFAGHGEKKPSVSNMKKTIPLYVGLATGFCGSFTSFSSFMRDLFLALANDLPTPLSHPYPAGVGPPPPSSTVPRNGGYSFNSVTAVIIFTLALSLGALFVGAHLAIGLRDYIPKIGLAFTRRFLDPLAVLLGWGCWIGAIVLAVYPPRDVWRGQAVFAIIFAPTGCLLRYYASLRLNGLVASFPLGTFAVNMLGSAVEAMLYDLQHVGIGRMGMAGGGVIGCQVLQGMQDGFCGCLTTVSTWVSEINGLRRRHGYIYAITSVLAGLCLMVIIMGSVRWSAGYMMAVCDTGYTSKMH